MVMNGSYELQYEVNGKSIDLLVEVKLKMCEDKVESNQNIYYGEVYIDGYVKKDMRMINWVNAKYAAHEIGLKLKNEILEKHKICKIIRESLK